MGDFCSSNIWASLNANKDIDFESFRELLNKLNGRLAARDPYDFKSFRYFKNIFFNTPVCMTDESFELYDKINNTNVGRALQVSVKNTKVNTLFLFNCAVTFT